MEDQLNSVGQVREQGHANSAVLGGERHQEWRFHNLQHGSLLNALFSSETSVNKVETDKDVTTFSEIEGGLSKPKPWGWIRWNTQWEGTMVKASLSHEERPLSVFLRPLEEEDEYVTVLPCVNKSGQYVANSFIHILAEVSAWYTQVTNIRGRWIKHVRL